MVLFGDEDGRDEQEIHVLCDHDVLNTAFDLTFKGLPQVHMLRGELIPAIQPDQGHPPAESDLINVASVPPNRDPMFYPF